MDFKPWKEIKQLNKGLHIRITEKIDGSNAQIVIETVLSNKWVESGITDYNVIAGSRTRFLSPGKDTDNYGFAAWVEANRTELIEKLGLGVHYGEYYGAGIGAKYGLSEKRLALFNVKHFPPGRPLPKGVDVVPVLYEGPFSQQAIDDALNLLKTQGSQLVKGFMNVEGVVVEFPAFGHSLKHVFTPEETGWKAPKGEGLNKKAEGVDVSAYLQPIRLGKLLSRDSTYLENYPESLPQIAKDYIADLEKEDQLINVDPVTLKAIRKQVFPWIKAIF